jgi:hypothetical protein
MTIGDVKLKDEDDDDPSPLFQVLPSSFSTSHKVQDSNMEGNEESIHQPVNDSSSSSTQDASSQLKIYNAITKDHPIDQIIGDINKGVQTRSRLASFCEHYSFVSCGEPTRIEETLDNPDWVNAMYEELNNFACNEVWELVKRPSDHIVIGTKWVFWNKQDENGVIVRNKERLVTQGYTQVEGLDFDETFAPIARLEAIRILLAYATSHNVKLYQIDVKSVFLNDKINKLVYVEQPLSFEDSKKTNHVYKLSKALYSLKQAPRAWYERLQNFLVSKGFKIGKMNTTLFTKKIDDDLFICQIYVDDIIFGSTNQDFCEEFGDMMSREFEISMIGELSLFLGLQMKQTKDRTIIYQSKYANDLLKRFGMDNSKPIKTPMATNIHLDLDEGGNSIDLNLYRSMIDNLFYLTASRPDIMFSVCMCAKFHTSPKE